MDATQQEYIDEACGKIRQWEGSVPWMYLDEPGLVTVADGRMLPNAAAACALPFQAPGGGPASHELVEADFARVAAMEPNHLATFYLASTSCKLLAADIEALLFSVVCDCDRDLAGIFTHYADWPKSAKLATIDMRYNLGKSRLIREYPNLIRAASAENWPVCAAQCGRDVDDAAFASRNYWTRCTFLDAEIEAKAAGVLHQAAATAQGAA